MPSVSVIIPCYNASAFLAEAIASARAQTLAPAEVLVVDDQSTDGSPGIARQAGARVLSAPTNAGPASARNIGIATATGDLIAFLDADDCWLPGHLEACAGLLARFPEAGVAFSLVTQFGDRDLEAPAQMPAEIPSDIRMLLWRSNPIAQSAAVVRRGVLTEVGGYRPGMRHAEDYELWLRIADRHQFACTGQRLVRYRVHGAQFSQQHAKLLVAAWEVRRARWETANSAMDADARHAVLDALHQAYLDDLRDAWHYRSRELLATALRVGTLVPEGEEIQRRWRRKARWFRPLWRAGAYIWDRLPESWRTAIRNPPETAPTRSRGLAS